MKIHKTKQEKNLKAQETATLKFDEVKEKVEKYGKLKVTFDRDDFKSNLSTGIGYGFQDLKKEYRIVITNLVKEEYKIKFYPTTTEKGFGVDVVIKR